MSERERPYSHVAAVATLHGQTHLRLAPDEAIRARIAKMLGLHRLDSFDAAFDIDVASNGLVSVTGKVEAKVQPICVVSLEPFRDAVSEDVDIRFAPEDMIGRMIKKAEAEEDDAFEPPDPLEEGMIDFGALAVEFLALGLDPYPKKPGMAFEGVSEEVSRASPFEKLKDILPKQGNSD